MAKIANKTRRDLSAIRKQRIAAQELSPAQSREINRSLDTREQMLMRSFNLRYLQAVR